MTNAMVDAETDAKVSKLQERSLENACLGSESVQAFWPQRLGPSCTTRTNTDGHHDPAQQYTSRPQARLWLLPLSLPSGGVDPAPTITGPYINSVTDSGGKGTSTSS